MLKKILTGAAAALTLGGAVVATATPAAAQYRGGYNGGYHGGYYGGHRGYKKRCSSRLCAASSSLCSATSSLLRAASGLLLRAKLLQLLRRLPQRMALGPLLWPICAGGALLLAEQG